MACKAFVRRAWQTCMDHKGHDAQTLGALHIVGARPGWLHAQLKVHDANLNTWNGMHGGVTATLVDSVGGLGLATHGFAQTGVSTDIHVSYFRPARHNDILNIYSTVNFSGRTLANISVDIFGPSDKILARGSHTKFVGKTAPVTAFSPDGETEINSKL